jgi:Zn-dependent peptidase ImmA (M78 family)/transcriptional regulator with XRE-family HTH domain
MNLAETIGKRLRERREAMGADLSTVAQWAGTSRDRLALIEAGADDLESSEYERICHALAVEPSAVYVGAESDSSRTAARFRTAWGDDSPIQAADLRLLSSAAEAGRVLGELLRSIQKEPGIAAHRRTTAVSARPEPGEQGYQLGETARSSLSNPAQPLESVERFLTSIGVHIVATSFSTKRIEAASIWEPKSLPIILLNDSVSRVEYRLSRRAIICHELCHLLHDAGEGDLTTRTTWEQGNNSHHDATEQRARGFAPAFLGPRPAVQDWFGSLGHRRSQKPKDVALALADYWGLSYEGAVWHAKNSGLISESDCTTILSYKPRPGEINADQFEPETPPAPPEMLNPSLPKRAGKMMEGLATNIVVDALEKETISIGRAREILTWY